MAPRRASLHPADGSPAERLVDRGGVVAEGPAFGDLAVAEAITADDPL